MRAAVRLTERVGRERTDKLKKVKRICLFGEEINGQKQRELGCESPFSSSLFHLLHKRRAGRERRRTKGVCYEREGEVHTDLAEI